MIERIVRLEITEKEYQIIKDALHFTQYHKQENNELDKLYSFGDFAKTRNSINTNVRYKEIGGEQA